MMFGQALSTLNTDKWASGDIEINNCTVKFPTSALSVANIAYVGWFKTSWKNYMISTILGLISLFFVIKSLPYLQFGISYFITSANFWSGAVIGFFAWLLFPKYPFYVLINSNSARTQMINVKTEKFASNIKDAVVKYIENRDLKHPTNINITAGKIEGDIVHGNKSTLHQGYPPRNDYNAA